MNEDNVRKYLEVIKRATQLIERELTTPGTPEQLMGEINMPAPPAPPVQNIVSPEEPKPLNKEEFEARQKHIQDLMAIDCWPEAVPDYLVNDETKENQINRANMVLDWLIDRPIEGKDFLDFGCGDGWITKQALNRGVETSTGYDIKESPNWANIEGVTFTTDLGSLSNDGYDVIMLYDVLDHCEDPVGVMQTVKGLLKFNGGVVYVRCHPWTSKHATHAYKQGLNKAFIHLFLTWEEIDELLGDQEPMFTRKEISPTDAYHWWFHEFNIVKERFVKGEPVSNFFLVESFKDLVIQQQQLPQERIASFFKDMEIDFIDYILEK